MDSERQRRRALGHLAGMRDKAQRQTVALPFVESS